MMKDELGLSEQEKQIIDRQQLETRFFEECKRLPYEYLESEEKDLVDKCLNRETKRV